MKIKLNAFFPVGQKYLPELKITYDNSITKQFLIEDYLDCSLDASLSGESIAIKSLKKVNVKKINAKLRFLYSEMSFKLKIT